MFIPLVAYRHVYVCTCYMYMCVHVTCICVYMYVCLVCRCRLESSMDQWSDLIEKIRRLIDYLTSRENELIAARPVAGNLPAIKSQQTKHQVSTTPARCPKNILRHTPCLLGTIIYSYKSLVIYNFKKSRLCNRQNHLLSCERSWVQFPLSS